MNNTPAMPDGIMFPDRFKQARTPANIRDYLAPLRDPVRPKQIERTPHGWADEGICLMAFLSKLSRPPNKTPVAVRGSLVARRD